MRRHLSLFALTVTLACCGDSSGGDAGGALPAAGASVRGKITAAGGKLATADGRFEIEFPPGAVDRDVDVGVTPVGALEYRLEPDGLRLKVPATARLRIDDGDLRPALDDAGKPLAFDRYMRELVVTLKSADGQVEMLNVKQALSEDRRSKRAETGLVHFSTLTFTTAEQDDVFYVFAGPDQAPVGELFETNGSLFYRVGGQQPPPPPDQPSPEAVFDLADDDADSATADRRAYDEAPAAITAHDSLGLIIANEILIENYASRGVTFVGDLSPDLRPPAIGPDPSGYYGSPSYVSTTGALRMTRCAAVGAATIPTAVGILRMWNVRYADGSRRLVERRNYIETRHSLECVGAAPPAGTAGQPRVTEVTTQATGVAVAGSVLVQLRVENAYVGGGKLCQELAPTNCGPLGFSPANPQTGLADVTLSPPAGGTPGDKLFVRPQAVDAANTKGTGYDPNPSAPMKYEAKEFDVDPASGAEKPTAVKYPTQMGVIVLPMF